MEGNPLIITTSPKDGANPENIMSKNLEELYEQAVAQYGKEQADRAAAISIEYYNANALAGFSEKQCVAEQVAAFQEVLWEEED